MDIDTTLNLHRKFLGHVGGSNEAAAMLVLAYTIRETSKAQPNSENLSVKQAAKELGVSAATVYALCDTGRLRHRKIGRAIRIQPQDLQAFMDATNQDGAVSFPLLGV